VRIARWMGGELPEAVADVLRKGLNELGETADEIFVSLDRAASERNLTFIASDDRRPIGVLIALPKPSLRSAFVLWIVVAPDARRRGVGTALVEALEVTADLEVLEGMVDQEDPAALGFWRDRGWTVSGTRPGRRQRMEVRLPAVAAEAA
jgi:GNAT superfamily N-acetyltransferase